MVKILMLILLLLYPGTDGIIKKIREVVGDKPVYLSIDVRGSDQVDDACRQLTRGYLVT